MADHEHKDEHGEGEGHSGGSHGHGGGGHGGGGHEEAHEGAPEWLISFADNVALMMGFFVILLAMNMGPKAKSESEGNGTSAGNPDDRMLDFVIAVREGFNNPIDLGSDDPQEARLRERLLQRLNGGTSMDGPEGKHKDLQATRPTDYTNIGGRIDFDEGSSLINPAARDVVDDVADRVKGLHWIIEVRGHASPFETLPERDPLKAFQLSSARAMAVAQAMAQRGVRWDQIRVVACGDGDRIVGRAHDSKEDAANQRVEIVVTKDLLPPDPYSRDESGATREPDATHSHDADAAEPDAGEPSHAPAKPKPGGH
jgi:outer membrane protein OmpA-like peptidoglycan-associated protein